MRRTHFNYSTDVHLDLYTTESAWRLFQQQHRAPATTPQRQQRRRASLPSSPESAISATPAKPTPCTRGRTGCIAATPESAPLPLQASPTHDQLAADNPFLRRLNTRHPLRSVQPLRRETSPDKNAALQYPAPEQQLEKPTGTAACPVVLRLPRTSSLLQPTVGPFMRACCGHVCKNTPLAPAHSRRFEQCAPSACMRRACCMIPRQSAPTPR